MAQLTPRIDITCKALTKLNYLAVKLIKNLQILLNVPNTTPVYACALVRAEKLIKDELILFGIDATEELTIIPILLNNTQEAIDIVKKAKALIKTYFFYEDTVFINVLINDEFQLGVQDLYDFIALILESVKVYLSTL